MPGLLEEYFGDLPDPCIDRTKKHQLIDIMTSLLSRFVQWCVGQITGLQWKRLALSVRHGCGTS